MKKFWGFYLILCLVLVLQWMIVPVAASDTIQDPSVTQGCRGIDAGAPFLGTDQKISNAEAVFLYETTTDTLMYAWNADKPMYPASFVKIMTALIALEQCDVTELVTVRQSALSSVAAEATSVDLVADEVLTLEQLLYCMMVESANDAAAVIADHVAGSQGDFVERMNARAAELGCTGTNFTNAHGLHDEAQVTTARDMGKILQAAMENEAFRVYFKTTHYVVEATNKSEARKLSTGNHTMHKSTYEIYYDDRVIGGRTGTITTGERCFAAAAVKGDMELISIVMGSKSTFVRDSAIVDRLGGFDETRKLLDLGFNGLKTSQIFYENQALQQHKVTGGDADLIIGPQKSVSSVLAANTDVSSLNFRYSAPITQLRAPIEKGAHIMDLEVWDGNVCVAYAPLYAMNSVDEVKTTVVNTEGDESGSVIGTVLLVILIIAAAGVVVLGGLRFMNRRKAASSAKRRRRKR